MNKKKTFTILGVIIGVLVLIVLILVFFVLPTCFASTESEIKEMEQTNVDSFMNIEVPDEPDVPSTSIPEAPSVSESVVPAATESDATSTAETDSLNQGE